MGKRRVQRVQTQAGARKYGVPVGARITARHVKVAAADMKASLATNPVLDHVDALLKDTPKPKHPGLSTVHLQDTPRESLSANIAAREALRAEHARINAKRDKRLKKLKKKGKYSEVKGNALRLEAAAARAKAVHADIAAARAR